MPEFKQHFTIGEIADRLSIDEIMVRRLLNNGGADPPLLDTIYEPLEVVSRMTVVKAWNFASKSDIEVALGSLLYTPIQEL